MNQPMYENANKRNVHDTEAERDNGYGSVRNHGAGNKEVELFWNFNDQAKQDHMVRVKIGSEEAIVSATQLQKFLRWA